MRKNKVIVPMFYLGPLGGPGPALWRPMVNHWDADDHVRSLAIWRCHRTLGSIQSLSPEKREEWMRFGNEYKRRQKWESRERVRIEAEDICLNHEESSSYVLLNGRQHGKITPIIYD